MSDQNLSLRDTVIHCLYAASSTTIGHIALTNDPRRARDMFLRIKKELNDDALASIRIKFSPSNPEGEILLINSSNTHNDHNNNLQTDIDEVVL